MQHTSSRVGIALLLAGAVAVVAGADSHEKVEGEAAMEVTEGEATVELCDEGDARPECQQTPPQEGEVKERGVWIGIPGIPIKLANEGVNRCLRPQNGSRIEGRPVVLDTCASTTSRYWITKEERGSSSLPGGRFLYRFKNQFTGFCLEKRPDGSFIQKACTDNLNAPQWFSFEPAPWPPFAGEFLYANSYLGGRRCLRGRTNGTLTATEANCPNFASRRWRRNLF